MTRTIEAQRPLPTDPYTGVVDLEKITPGEREGAAIAFADLGDFLELTLTNTFNDEKELSTTADVTSDKMPGYNYALREQAAGLSYVFDLLGQEKVRAVAEERATMPTEVKDIQFPQHSEPDPFREAVVKQIKGETVPNAAVTVIASLGKRYLNTLFAARGDTELDAPPIKNPTHYAIGLRFILNALGQDDVAEVANEVFKSRTQLPQQKPAPVAA